MKIKVLFMDDIFSDTFRKNHDSEHLAFDDAWIESIEKELFSNDIENVTFDLVKNGDIGRMPSLIQQEKPDIVLLDLYWYEDAGKTDLSLAALREIRKSHPDLPVIQYTIKPDKEIMDRSYEAGATFFLAKVPLPIPEVHTALKYIMVYLKRNMQGS